MTISAVHAGNSAYTTMARALRAAGTTATPQGTASRSGSAVVVELSPQARAATARDRDPTAYFARFFPTRDGEPAGALATAVWDPGAASSSAGKTFEEVAADARARMDANYADMAAGGTPFDADSFEGKDCYSLMGDLDRRSLQAVAGNAEGLFTEEEQETARTIMIQQQGLAMGLYTGPTSQQGNFVDPFAGDHAARLKAGAAFLDQVSDEEKTSVTWASARASAQISYEWNMEGRRGPAENLDSDVPLVRLIKSAMDTMRSDTSRAWTRDRITAADDLRRQPWFQGFEDRLPGAIRATESMFGSHGVAITA